MTVPDKPPAWKANAAECITTTVPNPNMPQMPGAPQVPGMPAPQLPNLQPQQFPNSWVRSADGKMRMDFANMSLIQDPVNRQLTTIDHVKQQYHITPFDPKSAIAGLPGAPGMPAVPQIPPNTIH